MLAGLDVAVDALGSPVKRRLLAETQERWGGSAGRSAGTSALFFAQQTFADSHPFAAVDRVHAAAAAAFADAAPDSAPPRAARDASSDLDAALCALGVPAGDVQRFLHATQTNDATLADVCAIKHEDLILALVHHAGLSASRAQAVAAKLRGVANVGEGRWRWE